MCNREHGQKNSKTKTKNILKGQTDVTRSPEKLVFARFRMALRGSSLSALRQCEFFLLRYAPNPFSEEAVNIGLVLRDTSAGPDQQLRSEPAFQEIRFPRKWSPT